MSPYFLFGIGAAIAWGTADFCAKKSCQRAGFWPTLLGMNAVGAALLGVLAVSGVFHVAWPAVRPLLGLAVGNTLGGLLFYYALEHGPISIVSPITAGYPVVSVALAYLLSAERMQPRMASCVLAVILGTVLTATGGAGKRDARPNPSGVDRRGGAMAAALVTVLVFGVVFYGLAAHAGAASALLPVLVFRCAGVILLSIPLLLGRRFSNDLWRSPWLWATGVLDTGAYLLYVCAGRGLPISLVSALGGLFCAWTLVLGVVLLRERPTARQWVGLSLILAAIGTLAFVH